MKELAKFCEFGQRVVETEMRAIATLHKRINEDFARACQLLLECKGRIIVCGMGKSGHIGRKIAATLASTGTPAFFVHPGEANHGDMGMITRNDVVLAISNSGETAEILTMLPLLKWLDIPLISLSGNPDSTLAKSSHVYLDISIDEEACPLGLAPTSSTTATLVMGDAIAIALLQVRGFTAKDFALYHPGGSLGKRLLLKIDDIMHTDHEIPVIHESSNLQEALVEMTQKRLGMTTIINDQKKLVGVYTDGDLRRTLNKDIDVHETKINEVMTRDFKTITKGTLAIEAVHLMEKFKITTLTVLDEEKNLVGVVHMHDLLTAGLA